MNFNTSLENKSLEQLLFKSALEFNAFYSDSSKLGKIPKLNNKIIKIMKYSNPSEDSLINKAIVLIFMKIYFQNLYCCHQSYDVRRLNNSYDVRRLNKSIVYSELVSSFVRVLDFYKIKYDKEFIPSGLVMDLVVGDDYFLNDKNIDSLYKNINLLKYKIDQ